MALEKFGAPRLTVAIPLFHAAPWHDTLVHNIQRIPGDALILLSDETSSDDTAQLVANRFTDDPRIRVRLCNGNSGWRAHCNALIQECGTEFFSLLPQDDLIAPGYYEKLVAALDSHPEAGLAFGTLIANGGQFSDPVQLSSPPFKLGLLETWREAIELERHWNLGIPFRGVIRRNVLKPISPTPGDQFADQVWVFGMALAAYLLEVPDAVYFKIYHAGNTHSSWKYPQPLERKAQLTAEIRNVLGVQESAERAISLLDQKYREIYLRKWRALGIC